ncbi:hypothetical protein EsH8_IV_001335 [Colletotrichum jinshuiense]
MQITSTLVTLAFLAVGINAVPVPLNINLGAYSPALVVGDGALTFGGGEAAAGGEGAAAAAAAVPNVPGAAQRGIIAGRDEKKMEKRQSGFDRALTFAEAALTKGPKVQLGNGEGGAGVGMIVDPNAAKAAPAAGGAAAGGEA